MQQILLIIHTLVCIGIIGLVLLQHGKGADMGVAFGSSSAKSFFGSKGSSSFLVKTTTILAILFFSTCLSLGYLMNHGVEKPIITKQTTKN
jgi:preprotein translocase subunit SecG